MDWIGLLYDVQAILNIVFGVLVVYFSGRACIGFFRQRPVCVIISIVGLLWSVVYVLIFLRELNTPGIPSTGHWTVRPMVTLTLASLASMSIVRQRRFQKEKEIIDSWIKHSD